jgi:two-component system, OmpR family, sensor histidine kinase PrrB
MSPNSLTGRVTLAAVAAVGGALLVAGLAVIIFTARSDQAQLDRDLTRLSRQVDRRAGPVFSPPDQRGGRPDGPPGEGRGMRSGRQPRENGPLEPSGDRFTRVVLANGQSYSGGATVPANFPLTTAGEIVTVSAGGEDWRTLVTDLRDGDRLQVAARLSGIQDSAKRLRIVVLAALLGALLATALVTRSLARLALGPLRRLATTADQVAATADLAVRVPVGEGPEEIDELAADINAMLSRLQRSAGEREAALASARRFAADAGHELRNPLTSLRANLSLIERSGNLGDEDVRAAVSACAGDSARLVALVDQLQQLARGEAGPPATSEQVDLSELADTAVVALAARFPDVTTRLRAPESGPLVKAEAESLRMLLDNLLDNAALHGRPDGNIEVVIELTTNGDAVIEVNDDGPGIAEDQRARVLERFVRGEGARGAGTGLGLAIAAAQAARYGGSLTLGASPLGGLQVRVAIPGAASP